MDHYPDRAAFLAAAARPSETVGKRAFVLEHCGGRSVLDIGCVDHTAENAFHPDVVWLHREIVAVAARTLGLDMLEEDVSRLVAAGYQVVVGDAEHFDLGQTFDVVVAADIIEHLSDLGSFLRCVGAHMTTDSTFVLTTPNPFAVARFAQGLFRNDVHVNAQHTAWFDPAVLYELLHRHGFVPTGFAWLHDEAATGSAVSKVLDRLTGPLLKRRPVLRRTYGIAARRA